MNNRMADFSDIEALTELRLEFLFCDHTNMTEAEINSIRQSLPEYYINHLNRDLFIYVAEEEGEVIATVYLLIHYMPANPNFLTGKIGEVLSVYTKPEYRGGGVSTHLIEQMLKDAEDRKLSYVRLEATKEGYPVYKRVGFQDETSNYKSMKYKIGGSIA